MPAVLVFLINGKSTDGGATWNNIGGATSSTYSIASVQPTDAGQYRCVVSTLCGSTNSNAATLTVNTPPAITTQPYWCHFVCRCKQYLYCSCNRSGLTYQWQSAATCAGPGQTWQVLPTHPLLWLFPALHHTAVLLQEPVLQQLLPAAPH